jgi:hypothetical protein
VNDCGHFIRKCLCGNILAQCRCMSPLKSVELVTTCPKCEGDRCQFRHTMSAESGILRCRLKSNHGGDCLIEWRGTAYAVSPNGYEAHPPRVVK